MNNLKWYERVIISTILTAFAFIVCLFLKSDQWILFGVGSFGYQIIAHFRFNLNSLHEKLCSMY